MPHPDFRDDLVPADEALAMVLSDAIPTATESLALKDAVNRVLAEDLTSRRTQPPFDASAMDGYAVLATDVQNVPVTLNVIGESAAGHPFDGTLSAGESVRTFTGAIIPEGADTIIIQENTTAEPGKVTVLTGAPEGKFIRRAGMDFKTGDKLLKKGDVLDAPRLSLAASMNYPSIEVYRKPLVALLTTGDELVLPGNELKPGQIIASNVFGLIALVQENGGEVLNLGIVTDTMEALQTAIGTALSKGADIIVTTGGASVGDHDLVKPAMENAGFQFLFHKLAMRPGKPLLFAKRKSDEHTCRLVGLAGNPVSSLVAGPVFLRPLIRSLAGFPLDTIEPISAKLGTELVENDERMEFMRAMAKVGIDGTITVTPFSRQDSSMLANLAAANCLLVRPIRAEAAKPGDACQIVPLRPF
ncbi:MAG: molybdopterin molybdotransferase MoeA [Rhizobiaceae bacterium]|nr:molybdopterin molybdotransferase MoeA [Rhizobiaceae bacterium]